MHAGPTAGSPGPGAAVTTPPVVVVPPIPEVVTDDAAAHDAAADRATVPISLDGVRQPDSARCYHADGGPVFSGTSRARPSVTVCGPDAKSTKAVGIAPVCPGTSILRGVRVPASDSRGFHTYVAEAYDAAGSSSAARTLAELRAG